MIDLRIYKKWKVFVCHATDDKKKFVDSLVENLQKRGTFLWYDKISIPEGESIHDAIHKGLKGAKGGIVIFSPDFIKDYSHEKREWVKEEYHVLVYKKNTEGCFLIPVFYNIDPKYLPESFKGPLDNIKGFVFSVENKDDNIFELSGKIHILVKKIQSKQKRKMLFCFLFIIAIILFFAFHAFKIDIEKLFSKKEPVTVIDTVAKPNPVVTDTNNVRKIFKKDSNNFLEHKGGKGLSKIVSNIGENSYNRSPDTKIISKTELSNSKKKNNNYINPSLAHIKNKPVTIQGLYIST